MYVNPITELSTALASFDNNKYPDVANAIKDVLQLLKDDCTDNKKWGTAKTKAWAVRQAAGDAVQEARAAAEIATRVARSITYPEIPDISTNRYKL